MIIIIQKFASWAGGWRRQGQNPSKNSRWIRAAELGNFGDVEPTGEGVSEAPGLLGTTQLTEPFESALQSPLEVLGGARWYPTRNVAVLLGAGTGLTRGAGDPDVRALAGIHDGPRDEAEAPPPPPPVESRNPDTDGDGICDPWVADKHLDEKYEAICKATDKCPNEPETKNGHHDGDGCPDKAVIIEKQKVVILQVVNFYFDKTKIKEESFPLLDEVVSVLKEHPELSELRVEGHTDLRGKRSYNKKLSHGRAKAVYDYLIAHGIDVSRLTYQGYGMERPLIEKAKTEEEHLENRRVEFIILARKDK